MPFSPGEKGICNLRTTRPEPTEGGKPDALYGWPEDGLCPRGFRPGNTLECTT